jgi:uncharacterized protein YcfL
MKKIFSMISVLALMLAALSGCSKSNPVAPATASSSQGQMLFAMEAADNVVSGKVTITKGAVTQMLPISITNHSGTVSFNGIQVGTWQIQVQLFDAAGVEIYTGSGTALVTLNATTTVKIRVNHNTGNLQVIVEVPGLVLWNKLGSVDEVTHSLAGPNLTFSGNATDNIVFESAKYDNGFRSESRWRGVEVPAASLDPNRGCYEMWFKSQMTRPVAYQRGRAQWLDQSAAGAGGFMQLVWDDATPYGGLNNEIDVYIGDTDMTNALGQVGFTAEIGRLYHIALVWDANGIDGTGDTVRIYIDGTLCASTTQTYNPIAGAGVGNIGRIQNTTPGWDDCYGKLTFDNLKIWNYPKIDFSDRFYENGNSPTPTLTATMTPTPTAINPTATFTPTATPLPLPMGGYATPNPFNPSRGERAFFNFQATEDCTVRILARNGRLVKTLHNENIWDGRDEQSAWCENGIYIYQIESGHQRKNGTVVLIK